MDSQPKTGLKILYQPEDREATVEYGCPAFQASSLIGSANDVQVL